jgi:hypothetical protein
MHRDTLIFTRLHGLTYQLTVFFVLFFCINKLSYQKIILISNYITKGHADLSFICKLL